MAQNGISTSEPKSDRRDLKLALAATKRQQTGTNGYRQYNVYESPGTVSPEEGRPWLLFASGPASLLLTEDDLELMTEDGKNIIL
jgi:hypothetical protein